VATADARPEWSPDGTRIAFLKDNVIWAVAPDGTDLAALVRSQPGSRREYIRAHRWPPDGRKIAFAESQIVSDTAISILDTDTGARKQVFSYDTEFTRIELAWSPDGNRLLFASTKGSSCEFNIFNFGPGGTIKCDHFRLYTVRADGSELKPLGRQEFRSVDKLLWVRVK
jgi:Tol biopolymer transport system component